MTARNQDVNISLYWLNESRAQNILWLLEALELPYQIKPLKREPSGFGPPELKEIHPLGKSPVVVIERDAGRKKKQLVLAESGNIIEYLVEHFGGVEKGLVPKRYDDGDSPEDRDETEEWLRYRFFMHYSEGSFMPNLVLAVILRKIRESPVPFFLKPITNAVANKIQTSFLDRQFGVHFPFLEGQLKTAPGGPGGLCGKHFTAADMLISFGVIAATEAGLITQDKYPEIVAYTLRIKEDEAYKTAIAKVEGL